MKKSSGWQQREIRLKMLGRVSFFKDFSGEDRRALVENDTAFIKYNEGDIIIKQGEKSSEIYVILTGGVKIVREEKKDVSLAKLEAGSVFGEIALISKKPRTTSVVALKETVVWKITNKEIVRLGEAIEKKFQRKIIELLIERLDVLNVRLTKLEG